MNLPSPPQTPALVIDRKALLHNLTTMQQACSAAGVRLRPHGKMHKCSTLAKLQMNLGAVGLCCQTVGEAEAFARAGIADILVSAPIPSWGPARLAKLVCQTGVRLSVCVDSKAQLSRLSDAALAEKVTLGCTVDVNIGMHRVGCSVAEAPELASLAAKSPAIRYDGIQAYFGHLQHQKTARKEANLKGVAELQKLVSVLSDNGLRPAQVTGGGTGTYEFDLNSGVFTEVQCGSYALMDAEYGDCGGPEGSWPFRPALFIAASVISTKHKSHVTIDVGLKASSADVPPRLVAGAPAGCLWRGLGDEHSALFHPATLERLGAGIDIVTLDADSAIPWPADLPSEGQIVWFQPGHCDPTINLYDAFYVTTTNAELERWSIDARRVTPD